MPNSPAEKDQAFLLQLSDTLRAQTGVEAVGNRATQLLAQRLGADRVYLVTLNPDDDTVLITQETRRPDMTPLKGAYRSSDFPSAIQELFDHTIVYTDVRTDARLTEPERRSFAGLGAVGFIAASVRRGSQTMIWAAGALSTLPRAWAASEVTLFEDAIERTWAAVERARVEEALRESEARHRFLLQFGDTLRTCPNEMTVLQTAARLLGEYLKVDRAFFGEIHHAQNLAIMHPDYVAGELPSLAGRFKLSDFSETVASLDSGQPIVINEVAKAAQLSPKTRSAYLALGYAGFLSVPLFNQQGQVTLNLSIVSSQPRPWSPAEVQLTQEVAARTGNLVERLRAEETVRNSKDRQAFLLEVSDELSRLRSPDEITEWVGSRIGVFLRLSTCVFADVDEDRQEVVVRQGWNAEPVPSLKQTFRMADYLTDEFQRAGRAGEPMLVSDTQHDPRVDAAAYARLTVGSFVIIPFHRAGKWTHFFAGSAVKARTWMPEELTLFRELCDRVFPRIERARAEDALRKSEEQFRLLSLASSDSIYSMSPDWTQMRQLMGKSFLADTDRPSASWLETYIPASEQAHVQQIIQQAIHSKSPFELEHRVLRADGRIGWTFSRAIPMFDEQGTIQQWLGAASDITARKEAETALYRSEARQRAILDSAKDYAIFTTDLYQRVTSWNPGAQALFGYLEAAILDQPVDWLYNPQDRQQGIPQLEAKTAIETGRFDNERWHSRQDGSLFYGSGVVTPLRDETGTIMGLLKVMRDLTPQKRAEQALQQADQRKDEFLAMLAHELRNPMSTLRSGLQILSLTDGNDETSSATIAMMNRQTDHLVRMVDDLLDVSRIRQGKIELKTERVNLVELVSQAAESVRSLYQDQGKRLQVDLPPAPIYLAGDATRLTQVVANLLTNGARYTGEQGQVWLHLAHQDEEAILRVSDNGVGLGADQLEAIFELFVQVDNSAARSKGGLGLGLTLVKRLVELHGGHIEAQSNGLDQGSTFTVGLPTLVTATDPLTQPVQSAPDPSAPQRILVIDDNADAGLTLAMLLKLKGYEAHSRTSGRAGIEAADQLHPSAILLDIGMPELDGYATCGAIRAQAWGQHVVIIALTGYGQAEDRERTQEAGFDGHLVKPVDLGALTTLLTDLLEKRRNQLE